MVSATEGLDALVFTGGVGENAVTLRERAAQRLAYLGVGVNAAINGRASQDADVFSPGSGVRTVVVSAREDLELAAGARAAVT